MDACNAICFEAAADIGLESREVVLSGEKLLGVYTTTTFGKGDYVCEYAGELLSAEEAKARESTSSPEFLFYFKAKTAKGDSWCIDATHETRRIGRLINQRNIPNVVPKSVVYKDLPKLYLVAADDIPADTQLFVAYTERKMDQPYSATRPQNDGTSNLVCERQVLSCTSTADIDMWSDLQHRYSEILELNGQTDVAAISLVAEIGQRGEMEDLVQALSYHYQHDILYAFAVFDGHGGNSAALYCRDNLLHNIIHQLFQVNFDDFDAAIQEGFRFTNTEMLKERDRWPRTNLGDLSPSGTTATVLLLFRRRYYVGYVGDSNIYICQGNSHSQLTTPHVPTGLIDRQRIIESGGKITCAGSTSRVSLLNPASSTHKVSLNMARALGNFWSLSEKNVYVISGKPDTIEGNMALPSHFIITTDGCDWLMAGDLEPFLHTGGNLTAQSFCAAVAQKWQTIRRVSPADNFSAIVVSCCSPQDTTGRKCLQSGTRLELSPQNDPSFHENDPNSKRSFSGDASVTNVEASDTGKQDTFSSSSNRGIHLATSVNEIQKDSQSISTETWGTGSSHSSVICKRQCSESRDGDDSSKRKHYRTDDSDLSRMQDIFPDSECEN